ncbi:MAG: hypothetical protein IT453_09815 [Planctomycetes bacterium]|nr:hypothetical protein [Planctomycetota bacterium]
MACRSVCLALSTLLASCAHVAPESASRTELAVSAPAPQHPPSSAPSPEQRYWLLRDEIEALAGKHPWAGRYYASDTDSGDEFLLAPMRGWVRIRHGVGRQTFVGAGSIELAEQRLRFVDDGQVPNAVPVPVLLPVRWDARRYLLFPSGITSFLNDVNAGREQSKAFTQRLVCGGNTYAHGKPELPPELAKSVFEPPLVARVVRVEPRPPIDEHVNSSVELDVGSDDGVYVGMLLYPRLEGSASGWVSVTSVTHDTCSATCEGFTAVTPLEPGARFSSAPPARWAETR